MNLSDDDKQSFYDRCVVHIDGEGMEHLLWNGYTSKAGTGFVTFNYKTYGVHRLALILATSEDRKGSDACHSCRIKKCVSHHHLAWGTRKENMLDKVRDGTMRHTLTEKQVREIRKRYNKKQGITYQYLGHEYNVSHSTIRSIIKSLTWAHLV